MAAWLQTEFSRSGTVEKAHTVFEWRFDDYEFLSDIFINKFHSPKFILKSGGECYLTLKYDDVVRYGHHSEYKIDISISQNGRSQNYHGIDASVSFIGENMEKLITVRKDFYKYIPDVLTLFMKRAQQIEHYMRNDILRVLCEITTIGEIEKSVDTSFKVEFSIDTYKKFNVEIYNIKELYDVTFVIEGKKLCAHKLILATHSDVFKAMFAAPMKEQRQGIVNIIDANYTAFDAFLKCIYTGQVNDLENLVEDLIFLAEKYQVISLKQVCEQFMSNHLCNETAVKYLSIADKFSCKELKQRASKYVEVNDPPRSIELASP